MMRWCGVALALVCAVAAGDYKDNESVKLFQEYLQLNTTSDSDLSGAVEFWKRLAAQQGVEFTVTEYTEGYPVIVLKWPGSDPSLGSIMLNSHMDVVPADEDEGWTYPPFSGYLDDEGVIWGRGTQDMKSVSIQYWEALRRIQDSGITLLRDVYMTLMPDEEVGGDNGMVPFLASDQFKAMNVGLELDEGTSFDLPLSAVFYQDKVPWQIQVDCYAVSAHGSTFPATKDTAVGKCNNFINKLLEFRDEEYEKYETLGGVLNAGVYSSVNINIIQGGTANNVIPSHVSVVADIRLDISLDEIEFDAKLNQWVSECGDNVTLSYIIKDPQSPATVITANNPYWVAFYSTALQMGLAVAPLVPPGSTDARFVRSAGYPAFGFSPMPNTELLLHSVDERLSAATYLDGIDIYEALVKSLANIPGEYTSADPSVYIVNTA